MEKCDSNESAGYRGPMLRQRRYGDMLGPICVNHLARIIRIINGIDVGIVYECLLFVIAVPSDVTYKAAARIASQVQRQLKRACNLGSE